jgi:hypothetical protein
VGEWLALPMVALAGSPPVSAMNPSTKSSIPSPSVCSIAATRFSASAGRRRGLTCWSRGLADRGLKVFERLSQVLGARVSPPRAPAGYQIIDDRDVPAGCISIQCVSIQTFLTVLVRVMARWRPSVTESRPFRCARSGARDHLPRAVRIDVQQIRTRRVHFRRARHVPTGAVRGPVKTVASNGRSMTRTSRGGSPASDRMRRVRSSGSRSARRRPSADIAAEYGAGGLRLVSVSLLRSPILNARVHRRSGEAPRAERARRPWTADGHTRRSEPVTPRQFCRARLQPRPSASRSSLLDGPQPPALR